MNSALKWRDTIRESPVTAMVATRIVLHWMEKLLRFRYRNTGKYVCRNDNDVVSFSVNLLWMRMLGSCHVAR
jgi:hypothetical protein